jgi:serine O-acetyltransferase
LSTIWTDIYPRLTQDVSTAMTKDPSCSSPAQAVLHQGLHAIWLHRISHFLHLRQRKVLARSVSYLGRVLTGVDLHPGAVLCDGVFIDHGCGVVIGETAVLEEDVMLYHNVTVGSVGWWRPSVVDGRRHPIIRRGAVLCTGSLILGPVVVGRDATIGAHAVVLADVPDNARVAAGEVWRGGYEAPVAVRAAVDHQYPLEQASS